MINYEKAVSGPTQRCHAVAVQFVQLDSKTALLADGRTYGESLQRPPSPARHYRPIQGTYAAIGDIIALIAAKSSSPSTTAPAAVAARFDGHCTYYLPGHAGHRKNLPDTLLTP